MSLVKVVKVSKSPMAAMVAVGVFWGGFSALVPDIKASVSASDSALGMALIMSAIGGMSATYLVPRLGQALGRKIIPFLGIFLAAAFFYPTLASSVFTLGIALFFAGASVAALDISSNVRISALESKLGMHLMNANHAAFSLAFAGAALLTAFGRKMGYDQQTILPALSLIAVLMVFFMWDSASGYVESKTDEDEAPAGTKPPWTAILLTALILFTGFVGENATEAWSALHLERTLGAAPGEGSFGPATLGIVMGIVRLSGQFVAEKIGEIRLIFWSAICGVIGAIVIGAAPTQFVAILGIAIIATGMAVVVPTVNSVLGKLVREDQRSHAISRAWMFGMLGFFIGPSMMGFVSEAFGLRVAFFAIAFVVAAMIPAVLALKQQRKG